MKQNRSLVMAILVVIAVAIYMFFNRPRVTPADAALENAEELAEVKEQRILKKPRKNTVTTLPIDQQANPSEMEALQRENLTQILTDLNECLGENITAQSASPEEFLQSVTEQLGTPTQTQTPWYNWTYTDDQGQSHQLRLDLIDTESGYQVAEVYLYALDEKGIPIPEEVPPSLAVGATEKTIDEFLAGRKVAAKERARSVEFSRGERFDFIEKNGELFEFEFVKGEKFFRCSNMSEREKCQCMD